MFLFKSPHPSPNGTSVWVNFSWAFMLNAILENLILLYSYKKTRIHSLLWTHLEALTMVSLKLTFLASTTKWMQGRSPFAHSYNHGLPFSSL
jgi:putative exporter of polyketide antibiotics